MSVVLTVRLGKTEASALDAFCVSRGQSRSEVVRASLREYELREQLSHLHQKLAPSAQRLGWLSEDDVFREV